MTTAYDSAIDDLKKQMSEDPAIMQIVVEKVIAAAQGNERAAQWLKTTSGQLLLDAAAQYADEGGKITYPP